MSTELKLYHKTLAAEARIHRAEELKLKRRAKKAKARGSNSAAFNLDRIREGIYSDRVVNLRKEARAVNLARAFLKDRLYLEVENSTRSSQEQMAVLAEHVFEVLWSYTGDDVSLEDIELWMMLDPYENTEEGEDKYGEVFDMSWLFKTKSVV